MLALLAVSLAVAAPVSGPVTREFSYGADPFRGGWHRGVDFRAPRGAVVRAACAGRVAWAHGGVVTLRCGGWRVTHLPLATIAVAPGARIRAGARLGTVGRDGRHAGLHLGVRHAGDRFGYVDPVPLFAAPRRPSPPAPTTRRPETPRLGPRAAPRPVAPRIAAPHPVAPRPAATRVAAPRLMAPRAAPEAPAPRGAPARASSPVAAGVRVLAPWPAWLGLAILLLGAVGGGVRVGLRRRRAVLAAAASVGA